MSHYFFLLPITHLKQLDFKFKYITQHKTSTFVHEQHNRCEEHSLFMYSGIPL